MKKFFIPVMFVLLIVCLFVYSEFINPASKMSGAPPYHVVDETPPPLLSDEYDWLKDWLRPDGPARVGLQIGHLNNDQIPEELERLRGNTGAAAGGYTEVEVNLAIAEEVKKILEEKDVVVDLIPATVPVDYWADAFIAIHADGSTDTSMSGYKSSAPRRDLTGDADDLLKHLESEYAKETGFNYDPNISRNMRGYYAFSWWRYDHAVHPMTPAIIFETGFLTNPSDRRVITTTPEVPAQGLANGIINYLESKNLLTNN